MTREPGDYSETYIDQLETLWRADARDSLVFFCEYTSNGTWQPAPHLEILCDHLEAVERGEIRRLIVDMPPQHGKSEVADRKFPAWYLGRHPMRRIMLTAYGDDLAYDFSRASRACFEEWAPELWGLRLSGRSFAVGRWDILKWNGGITAGGIGGRLTGRGAWLAIVDDPIKNWEEANSPTYRERVWNWYQTVLRPRVHPLGAIVVIMTRWHEDDLVGRLLKQQELGGEKWTVLKLPALAEEGDPLGRVPGEPLWPERGYTREWYEETKRGMAPLQWAAMYQQRPSAAEGNLFKRSYLRYFTRKGDFYYLARPEGVEKVLARRCWIFQTCDPAASTDGSADHFVLATWAVTPKRSLLLLDVVRERLEEPDQPILFTNAQKRWHPALQGVEKNGLGIALYQQLKRLGLPIVRLKADKDKYTRALPAAARFSAGEVFLLEGAPWLGDYEDELLRFRQNAEQDDQVDVTSYAAIVLVQYSDKYGGSAGGEASAKII
ncbi:MAG: phage terminase large subunit [Bacteroidota bacterium]